MKQDPEEISEFIADLIDFSLENPIIVEGPKDKKSLNALRINSYDYNSVGIEEFSEKIKQIFPNSKRVLILTDFDKRGELLRKELKEALSRKGIEENVILRRKFYRITKLIHVEGFNTFMKSFD